MNALDWFALVAFVASLGGYVAFVVGVFILTERTVDDDR